jgi:hypothetical protein
LFALLHFDCHARPQRTALRDERRDERVGEDLFELSHGADPLTRQNINLFVELLGFLRPCFLLLGQLLIDDALAAAQLCELGATVLSQVDQHGLFPPSMPAIRFDVPTNNGIKVLSLRLSGDVGVLFPPPHPLTGASYAMADFPGMQKVRQAVRFVLEAPDGPDRAPPFARELFALERVVVGIPN